MKRGFEKINMHKDNEDIILPKRMTKYSVGYDFFSPISTIVPAKSHVLIKSGIKSYFQEDEGLFIYPRSSWGIKHGIQLKNSVGIVESDYYNNQNNEGEIMISLMNLSDNDFEIKKGDRFCQGIFKKILITDEDIPQSEKRIGGIGSTGK